MTRLTITMMKHKRLQARGVAMATRRLRRRVELNVAADSDGVTRREILPSTGSEDDGSISSQYQPADWLETASPQWHILCSVER